MRCKYDSEVRSNAIRSFLGASLLALGLFVSGAAVAGQQSQQPGQLDPSISDRMGEELIGMRVNDQEGSHFGTVIDLVKNQQSGEIELLVAHPRVLHLGERYAPIPASEFRAEGDQLQLTQQMSQEEFTEQARAFHEDPTQYQPADQNVQLSELEQQQQPAG